MDRRVITAIAVTAAALSASRAVQATVLAWQGGTGAAVSGNYTDGTTPNQTPTTTDEVNFGGGGTGTVTANATFLKMRIGHNLTPGSGTGTVTVSNGAALSVTAGAANNPGISV